MVPLLRSGAREDPGALPGHPHYRRANSAEWANFLKNLLMALRSSVARDLTSEFLTSASLTPDGPQGDPFSC